MFCFSSIASTSSRCSSPRGVTLRMPPVTSGQVNALLQQSNKWRLMPETLNNENISGPSSYYGAVHLTRLFGKLCFTLIDVPCTTSHTRKITNVSEQ